MALTRKSSRQSPIEAIIDITFADPTAYGTAENAFSLPQNAIIVGGDLTVVTPWNGTTNSLSLGDLASGTRYLSAVDLKAAARTALTLTGYKHATAEFLRALFAQTGTATAGAARLRIAYIVQGRDSFNQG